MADKEMVAGSKKQLQQQKKDAKEAIDKSIDEALQAVDKDESPFVKQMKEAIDLNHDGVIQKSISFATILSIY